MTGVGGSHSHPPTRPVSRKEGSGEGERARRGGEGGAVQVRRATAAPVARPHPPPPTVARGSPAQHPGCANSARTRPPRLQGGPRHRALPSTAAAAAAVAATRTRRRDAARWSPGARLEVVSIRSLVRLRNGVGGWHCKCVAPRAEGGVSGGARGPGGAREGEPRGGWRRVRAISCACSCVARAWWWGCTLTATRAHAPAALGHDVDGRRRAGVAVIAVPRGRKRKAGRGWSSAA